uniref:Phosphatidylinositol-glycan biosynthesis class X protein isoform X1 n=1 Tax=Rhizophora mucronata TaxID=61149 RepID=A0A2P2IWE5_RHIMU
MEAEQHAKFHIYQNVRILLMLHVCFGFGFCIHGYSTSTQIGSCKQKSNKNSCISPHFSSKKYIMESYFENYEALLESTFGDMTCGGLHFGGCKLLLNRPNLLLRLSVPQRNLIGEGSHRHLSSTIGLHFHPVSSSQLPSHFCKLLVIERLPSGVFADPFELQHLLHRGVFTNAAVFGDTNLELPSVHSNHSVVEIHMNLGPNIFSKQLNEMEISVQLPLHARYPPLEESGFSEVEFGGPDLYMHCSIEGYLDKQDCMFMPACDDDKCKTGNVIWRIPSGSKKHAKMVSVVTFVAAFISALLIVVASAYHSDVKFCKTAKQQ